MQTINETLEAIAHLRDDVVKLAPALNKAVAAATDPVTHASLHRMARVIGELRAVLETPVPSMAA